MRNEHTPVRKLDFGGENCGTCHRCHYDIGLKTCLCDDGTIIGPNQYVYTCDHWEPVKR